jgi:hypothetical protein
MCEHVPPVEPVEPEFSNPSRKNKGGSGEQDGVHHFSACKRRATSSALARLLKAEMRKYPSPLLPKPLPGVMTTLASLRMRSKACQLLMPGGVWTQI